MMVSKVRREKKRREKREEEKREESLIFYEQKDVVPKIWTKYQIGSLFEMKMQRYRLILERIMNEEGSLSVFQESYILSLIQRYR